MAKWPHLIAVAVGSTLAGYAHYLSGPVIAILFSLLAMRAASARNAPAIRKIVLTAIAAAAGLTPLLPTLSDQMARLRTQQATSKPAQPDAGPPMRWRDSAVCLALNMSAFPRPAGETKALLAGAVLMTIPAIALVLTRRPRDVVVLGAVTVFAVAFIPWLVQNGKLSPHVLRPKYFTGFAVLLCTLLAAPWANSPARWLTVVWMAAFVPLVALNVAADRRPIKWTFTSVLNQENRRNLADADVVLIQTIPRQRRLLVLPIAAKIKDASTLVVGTNAQLADLIRKNDLPSAPNGTYFYCAPYGQSRTFRIPKTP